MYSVEYVFGILQKLAVTNIKETLWPQYGAVSVPLLVSTLVVKEEQMGYLGTCVQIQ